MKGVRIPPALQEEIELTIARRNIYTLGQPWNFTGFILQSIRDKLDQMARSRRPRKRTKRMSDDPMSAALELAMTLPEPIVVEVNRD